MNSCRRRLLPSLLILATVASRVEGAENDWISAMDGHRNSEGKPFCPEIFKKEILPAILEQNKTLKVSYMINPQSFSGKVQNPKKHKKFPHIIGATYVLSNPLFCYSYWVAVDYQKCTLADQPKFVGTEDHATPEKLNEFINSSSEDNIFLEGGRDSASKAESIVQATPMAPGKSNGQTIIGGTLDPRKSFIVNNFRGLLDDEKSMKDCATILGSAYNGYLTDQVKKLAPRGVIPRLGFRRYQIVEEKPSLGQATFRLTYGAVNMGDKAFALDVQVDVKNCRPISFPCFIGENQKGTRCDASGYRINRAARFEQSFISIMEQLAREERMQSPDAINYGAPRLNTQCYVSGGKTILRDISRVTGIQPSSLSVNSITQLAYIEHSVRPLAVVAYEIDIEGTELHRYFALQEDLDPNTGECRLVEGYRKVLDPSDNDYGPEIANLK